MPEVSRMECCGIRELDKLSEMDLTQKGATAAMKEIKEQLTDEGHYDEHFDWSTGNTTRGDWIDEIFHCPAFFVFSQAGTPTDINGRGAYGDYFTAFIVEKGLGTVVESEPALNENSANLVKVFLWTVNQDAFKKWGAKKAVPNKKAKAA